MGMAMTVFVVCLFIFILIILVSLTKFDPVKSEMKYPITIDPSRSLEDMVKDGNYNCNPNINTENFPSQGEVSGEVIIRLFHFRRNISTADALAEMDRRGFRPATVRELIVFGAVYPDIQLEFPVIALGSVWQSPYGGGHNVVCFDRDEWCNFNLYWLDLGWDDSCQFAVVCKF